MVGGDLFRFWPIVVIVARMNWRCRRAQNECIKRGIIIPIPECKKNHSDPNNYTSITLLSTHSKIYDKILLRRYSYWFRTTSNQQGVADKGGSIMNTTALLFYEAIAHTENTYVALMYINSLIQGWISGCGPLFMIATMGSNVLLR